MFIATLFLMTRVFVSTLLTLIFKQFKDLKHGDSELGNKKKCKNASPETITIFTTSYRTPLRKYKIS